MRVLILLLLMLPVLGLAAQSSPPKPSPAKLSPPLTQWLNKAGAGNARVSVHVQAVDNGEVLASVAADRLMNPASVIKLITGWAALGTMGPEYRWQTRFYLDGPLQADGTLDGNLVVLGGGDPKLVVEDLTDLAARLCARGLRHIRGDLLLDDSLYAPAAESVVFDGQTSEPYNVRPNAAMMNFKATKFTLQPSSGRVAVELEPPLAGVRIDNRLKLVKGRCRHRARDIGVSSVGSELEPVIRLTGRYSSGCRLQWSFHAVLNHRQFIDAFFRAGWLGAGGTFDGRARFATGYLGRLSAGGAEQPEPWFRWESPRTLADVVTDINKFSNNVMTRQLVLHLGATSGARPANRSAGLSAIQGFLGLNDLQLPGLVIDNGAGLSRQTRITASGMTRVLRHISGSDQSAYVLASLPVAGVDGTMRWRLNKTELAGQAWLKTGSLDRVRSIAGYLKAASGRMYAVTMIANGPGARRTLQVQDALLLWIHRNG